MQKKILSSNDIQIPTQLFLEGQLSAYLNRQLHTISSAIPEEFWLVDLIRRINSSEPLPTNLVVTASSKSMFVEIINKRLGDSLKKNVYPLIRNIRQEKAWRSAHEKTWFNGYRTERLETASKKANVCFYGCQHLRDIHDQPDLWLAKIKELEDVMQQQKPEIIIFESYRGTSPKAFKKAFKMMSEECCSVQFASLPRISDLGTKLEDQAPDLYWGIQHMGEQYVETFYACKNQVEMVSSDPNLPDAIQLFFDDGIEAPDIYAFEMLLDENIQKMISFLAAHPNIKSEDELMPEYRRALNASRSAITDFQKIAVAFPQFKKAYNWPQRPSRDISFDEVITELKELKRLSNEIFRIKDKQLANFNIGDWNHLYFFPILIKRAPTHPASKAFYQLTELHEEIRNRAIIEKVHDLLLQGKSRIMLVFGNGHLTITENALAELLTWH
jgi:hypothetical protein